MAVAKELLKGVIARMDRRKVLRSLLLIAVTLLAYLLIDYFGRVGILDAYYMQILTWVGINVIMGVMYGLKAFVAAVVGGIGVIPGAMAGGMIMGLSEVFVIGFVSSTLKDAIAFVILILILLIKPAGLFGKAGREKV